MANKIKLARGTKSKIEQVKNNLQDYETVISTDTKEIAYKHGNNIVYTISDKIDTSIPSTPTDDKVPSTKLLESLVSSLEDGVLENQENITGKEDKSNKVSTFTGNVSDNTKYPSAKLVKDSLDGKANSTHNHDDRYYTETEVDTLLGGKSNTGHTHTKSDITDFPSLGQQWKLLRDRNPTTNLTSVGTGTNVVGLNLGTTINRGNVLAIEVSLNSGSYQYPTQVVIVSMNNNATSPTSVIEHYHTTISRLYGDRLKNYTFTCSYDSQTIYFGNKKYLEGYFSGNEIQWTTGNYTLYVGKVWRLEG